MLLASLTFLLLMTLRHSILR